MDSGMLADVTVPPRRVFRAILIASLACVVLSTHVFVAFDRTRLKVVQAPVTAAAGRAHVTTAGFSKVKALQPPFALIARLDTRTTQAATFLIDVDGTTVCEPKVSSGLEQRVDCVVRTWKRRGDHEITISGPPTRWKLDYLELAAHHGNTSGALELVILPADSRHFAGVAPAWSVALWLVLAAVLVLAKPRRLPRALRLLSRVFGPVGVALLTLTLVSQWVSDYFVVLSLGAFVRLLGVLLLCQIWAVCRWLFKAPMVPSRRWVSVARAAIVALLVLGAFGAVVAGRLRESYHGNYSGFLLLSEGMFNRNPLLNTRDEVRRTLLLGNGAGMTVSTCTSRYSTPSFGCTMTAPRSTVRS